MSRHSYMRGRAAPQPPREFLHPDLASPLADQVLDRDLADDVASAMGLMSDPTRVRILHALSIAGELCVFDLAVLLQISQSAISHQLGLLRGRRVVTRRKDGRMVFYRLADEQVRILLNQVLPPAVAAGGPILRR